jgi:hypothetical protein
MTISRRIVVWALAVLPLAACAIQDPPSGGPEDKRPPEVSATTPNADSAGVAPSSEIRIVFDEKMTRTRLERLVKFSPEVEFGKVSWDGGTLVIRPVALHADTTYVVEIAPGFADAHGVRATEPFRFAFATSAAIDTGIVGGRVYFRRKPSEQAVARIFVLPRDSGFVPEAGRPDRQVMVSPDGTYAFGHLPTNASHVVVWAFEDANSNGAFDAASEVGATFPDTLALHPQLARQQGKDIYIVDPNEPAEIEGKIVNHTGNDSFVITVTLTELADTMPPTFLTRCNSEGSYVLRPLVGRYLLQAFMDFDNDSLCGSYPCPGDSNSSCLEPCSLYPDTIEVEPGDKARLDNLDLPPTNGG